MKNGECITATDSKPLTERISKLKLELNDILFLSTQYNLQYQESTLEYQ